MTAAPLCGTHSAFVFEKGGTVLVGEIEELSNVRWNRIRDNISEGYVRVPTGNCCEFLSGVETVKHELHIYRSGEMVHCGPITRMEFEWDGVDIYSEDMLWVAKRRALSQGYNHAMPPRGSGPIPTLELVDELLRVQTYARNGDPWNMVPHLNMITGPNDPNTQRETNSWSTTIWEELDALARYNGIDYTVVGRDIFYFDVHYAWSTLADLVDGHLSDYPRIVEYGNSLATRYIKTDGSGFAAIATRPAGGYEDEIDYVDTINDQSVDVLRDEPCDPCLTNWQGWAEDSINRYYPATQSLVVPANSTLMPASPWDVNTLVPGSWFLVNVERQCRTLSEYQRLHEVRVEEVGGEDEKVQITTATAPGDREDPDE